MTITPDNGGDQLRSLSNLAEIAAGWGDGRPQCGRDPDAAIQKNFQLDRCPSCWMAAEAGFSPDLNPLFRWEVPLVLLGDAEGIVPRVHIPHGTIDAVWSWRVWAAAKPLAQGLWPLHPAPHLRKGQEE